MEGRFDAAALLAAVDAERVRRGMSWSALTQTTGVATSTIRAMPMRPTVEIDGVLQLLWWLGRSLESFVVGGAATPASQGDHRSTGHFLRLDTAALYEALDAARRARGFGWMEVAAAVSRPNSPVSEGMLKGLAEGGRWDVYRLVACLEWLGEPAERFTRLSLTYPR